MGTERPYYSGPSRKLDIKATFSGVACAFLDPGKVPQSDPLQGKRTAYCITVATVTSVALRTGLTSRIVMSFSELNGGRFICYVRLCGTLTVGQAEAGVPTLRTACRDEGSNEHRTPKGKTMEPDTGPRWFRLEIWGESTWGWSNLSVIVIELSKLSNSHHYPSGACILTYVGEVVDDGDPETAQR